MHPHRRTRPLLLSIACALTLFTLGVGGAAHAPAAGAAENTGDTSDFTFKNWSVDVALDVTAEGRATAAVTETIVAEFPDADQNRGIVRGLPTEYLSAYTHPRDVTVTDADGREVPFELEEGSDEESGAEFIAVLTGDEEYVHGAHTYVLSYTLDDVIVTRDDGIADEFYWDLIPASRTQAITEASAQIRFSPALAAQLTGDARCYSGASGAQHACDLRADSAAETSQPEAGTAVSVEPLELASGEGLTVAIGLAAGSVVQPASRLPNFALDTLPLILGGLGVAAGAAGSVAVARMGRTRRGTAPVIAQYDVPGDLPPLIAAPIAGLSTSPAPAQLVHLALQGATRLEESPSHDDGASSPGTAASEPRLAVRLIDVTRAVDPLDAEAVTTLFPEPTPGQLALIPLEDSDFSARMSALAAAGVSAADERGYTERVRSPLGRILGWVSIGIAALLAVSIVLGIATRLSITPAIAILLAVVSVVLGLVSLARHRVLTPLGAETRRYLMGVREFIRVAEADRIRVLQSPSTAERRAAGPGATPAAWDEVHSEHSAEPVTVIELYERLLPYAMLFGLEREWRQALSARYEAAPGYAPGWFAGGGVVGIAALDSTVGTMLSSLTDATTFSASSAGGATGGGFVGGGGGGGFAGGR